MDFFGLKRIHWHTGIEGHKIGLCCSELDKVTLSHLLINELCYCADQGHNGRVISPGYTDDPSGTLSQREDQPPAHVIGENVQASNLGTKIIFFNTT